MNIFQNVGIGFVQLISAIIHVNRRLVPAGGQPELEARQEK